MADDEYGEEYQDAPLGYGDAPPLPPYIDEPIYSDEQMYQPLGKSADYGIGPMETRGYERAYDWSLPIGEARADDEVPDDVNTGMTMAEDEGMSVGEPYAYDDQGITMDDRPLGFTPEMKKWAGVPDDPPGAKGKHYGAGMAYSKGYATEKAKPPVGAEEGNPYSPPGATPQTASAGQVAPAASGQGGGGRRGGRRAPGPSPVQVEAERQRRGDEAWGFAYDKAIEAGATPENAKGLAEKARARAESAIPDAVAVAKNDQSVLSPAEVNKQFLQQNGFYYPGHYLDSLDQALSAGEIDESTYNKLVDRYTETSVGQDRQLFDLRLDDARDQAKQSALEGGEAVKMGEASEAAQTQNLADQKRIAREYEQRRVRLQAQVANDETNMRKAIADYDKSEVDPNKHWSKATVGGRILAGISMALGAFGAALAHTPNYAMEIIENDINRDIAAQKANIEKKGQNVANQKGLVGFMYDKLGNLDAAEAAAKIQAYGSIKQQLELQAAKSQNVVLKGRAAISMKMVDRRIKEAELEYKQRSTIASEQWEAMQLKASRGGPGKPKEPKRFTRWQLLTKENDPGFYSPDAGGFFKTEGQQNKWVDSNVKAVFIKTQLKRLMALNDRMSTAERGGVKVGLTSADAQEAAWIRNRIAKAIEKSEIGDDSVLRQAEEAGAFKALPDPSDIQSPWNANQTYQAAYDAIDMGLKARGSGYGIRPGYVDNIDVDEDGVPAYESGKPAVSTAPMFQYSTVGDAEDTRRRETARRRGKVSDEDLAQQDQDRYPYATGYGAGASGEQFNAATGEYEPVDEPAVKPKPKKGSHK